MKTRTIGKLRSIPAVEKVLQALGPLDVPRPAVVAVVRRELAALRAAKEVPEFDAVLARIRAALDNLRRARIQPLINGTGIFGPHQSRTFSARLGRGRNALAPSPPIIATSSMT